MSSITCIAELAPILSLAQHHPEHGGLLGNDAIAQFFAVDAGSIRTLKKRLVDEQAIEENRHWLTGANNKTLWTIRGFIRLGMRLSSAPALAFQQHLENLLTALDTGQVSIVPIAGEALGVELVPVDAGELVPVPVPLAQDEPVSDEQVWAIARPIAAAVYEKRQAKRSSLEARVNDAIASELQQLEAQAEPLGKSIALQWGLPMDLVTPLLQGAA
jgi:hypothetical protein